MRAIRAFGESSMVPEFSSYPSFPRLWFHSFCAPTAINSFALTAVSESVSTMKRNGCLLLPLGARVAAKKISRSTSSGMGSSLYLRIARVVAMPSSNPTVSVAKACSSAMVSGDPSLGHRHLLPTSNAYDHGLRLLPELPQLFRRPMEHQATSLRVVRQ